MPWLIWLPSAVTRMVSVTSSAPSARTSMSLRQETIRSSAAAGPEATSASAASSRAISERGTGSGLGAELDLGRALDRCVVVLVELGLGKAERAGEQHVGKRLDARVEVAHRRVVVA